MRASDVDRQRAIRRLSAGYAAGQLGANTFAHRVDLAYRAGSRADLHALTADLSGRLRVVSGRLLDTLRSPRAASARFEAPSVWLTPPDPGEGPWLIGRDPHCHLTIDDMTVSRRHAALRWTAQGYALNDLDSTNGCYANGLRVSSVLLRPGDHLVLGQVRVRLSQRP
jgi:hypothetical protein